MNMHFQTFRLQPPHAPPSSGHAGCSGRAWPPIRIGLLSAVLRTSHFTSSLVSRIRPYRVCVATRDWVAALRTIRSLPVALHPVSPRRSYFPLRAGSSAREGLPPSCARSLSSARPLRAAQLSISPANNSRQLQGRRNSLPTNRSIWNFKSQIWNSQFASHPACSRFGFHRHESHQSHESRESHSDPHEKPLYSHHSRHSRIFSPSIKIRIPKDSFPSFLAVCQQFRTGRGARGRAKIMIHVK